MKKLKLIISSLLLSSCFSNKMISKQPSLLLNDIEYKLTKVAQNGYTNNYGGGGYYVVKNGKFYLIDMYFTNNSSDKKEVNLTEISLCNKEKLCLKPSRIDVKSFIDIPSDDIMTLKVKQKKGRTLIFPGPKDFIPKYVLLNNREKGYITFDYKK